MLNQIWDHSISGLSEKGIESCPQTGIEVRDESGLPSKKEPDVGEMFHGTRY